MNFDPKESYTNVSVYKTAISLVLHSIVILSESPGEATFCESSLRVKHLSVEIHVDKISHVLSSVTEIDAILVWRLQEKYFHVKCSKE